jgi:phospholipid/cholesterol/gamma-HCH transport system permease protein
MFAFCIVNRVTMQLSLPTVSIHDHTILCTGSWTLPQNLQLLLQKIAALALPHITTIDATSLTALDSAGAWVLWKLKQLVAQHSPSVTIVGLQKAQQSIFTLVETESVKIHYPPPLPSQLNSVERIGEKVVTQAAQAAGLISFLGEVCVHLLQAFCRISQIQWRTFLNIIDETGYRALGIVGLLCALIGVVITYQMGQQLKIYGANVFIVGLLGVGMLQEFAPLITAIIVAGRTSSAFAAQIGTMKVTQEIDALYTMGLSPLDRLVIPRILGLMITLPLLIIWADIFGILGGMVVAKYMLGIDYYNFLERLPHVIEASTFLKGLLKAPVFAGIVAGIGCFQGFKVTATADSVGAQTTKSVVQAIFLIIVADAIFSIILPWQKLS